MFTVCHLGLHDGIEKYMGYYCRCSQITYIAKCFWYTICNSWPWSIQPLVFMTELMLNLIYTVFDYDHLIIHTYNKMYFILNNRFPVGPLWCFLEQETLLILFQSAQLFKRGTWKLDVS